MESCPDCTYVEEQARDRGNYEIIDIGTHVRNLKEFLRLRDSSPAFDGAKRNGSVGIPCFVLEDGTVTLSADYVERRLVLSVADTGRGMPPADRDRIFRELLDRGVLIRVVGPEGWLRVCMGTDEEMARFRTALAEVLAEPRDAD